MSINKKIIMVSNFYRKRDIFSNISKLVIILFIFLCGQSIIAQEISVTFTVKDKVSKKPIEGALAYYMDSVSATNDEGKVTMSLVIGNQVRITHIGYKTAIYKFDKELSEIYMIPESISMKEIVLENKADYTNSKTILPKKSFGNLLPHSYGTGAPLGVNEIKAVFIPNTLHQKAIIQEILLEPTDYLILSDKKEKIEGGKYAPFKINLYTVDTLYNIPDKPIFATDFTAQLNRGENYVKIILKEKQAVFPEKGIFIIISSFDKEFYRKMDNNFLGAPAFKVIDTRKKSKFKQYNKNLYWGDEALWELDSWYSKYNCVYNVGLKVKY